MGNVTVNQFLEPLGSFVWLLPHRNMCTEVDQASLNHCPQSCSLLAMLVVQTPMQMPTHRLCDTPAHSHMLLDGSEIIPSLLPIFIPCFLKTLTN